MTPKELLAGLQRAARLEPGPSDEVREQILKEMNRCLREQSQAQLEQPPLSTEMFGTFVKVLTGVLVMGGVILAFIALYGNRKVDEEQLSPPAPPVGLRTVESQPDSAPTQPATQPATSVAERPIGLQPVKPKSISSRGSESAKLPDPRIAGRQPVGEKLNGEASLPETGVDEIVLIKQMTAAMSARQLKRVLELVAEHELEFPEGRFVEERRSVEARATCLSGHIEEGRSMLTAIEVSWPKSMYLGAIRHDCELESSPDQD